MLDIMNGPDSLYIESDNGWHNATLGTRGSWSANGAEIEIIEEKSSSGAGLRVSLSSPVADVSSIRLRWSRPITQPLTLLGDHWERAYGDLEWRGIVPERIMPWYFLVHDGSMTGGLGVKTGPAAFCFWELDSEGVTLTLDVRSGGRGVRLGQRQLDICTIVQHQGEEGQSAFAAARQLCSLMCDSPLLPKQPVYGGNNWYYAYGKSSDNEILADSEFIASLAPSASNRPFMVIDDGWQLGHGNGGNGGPWGGNADFPDMPGLAARMKQVGVQPGLWFRPLMTSSRVPEEWVRCERAGQGSVLDPSVPDVLEELRRTVTQMSNWGFRLLKHDFSTYDMLDLWGMEMRGNPHRAARPFRDGSRTTAEITLGLYRTIAEASGDSLVMGCNTVSHLAAGLVEIQRTGDDTSGKQWERTRYMGINTLAFRMAQHETFYSHDADCVGITEHVPWAKNEQWLRLLAESGTPLFVSAKPSLVSSEQRRALSEAFELAAKPMPPGEPLDWQYNTCPREWLLNGRKTSFSWQSEPGGIDDNLWWKG